jgi:hypothetical protein
MITEHPGRGPRLRIAAGVGLSLAVHGLVGWLLWRGREARLVVREEPQVELDVVERAVVEAPPVAAVEPAASPGRPARRSGTKAAPKAAMAPRASAGPETAAAVESHPLMRMRGGAIELTPGADTLARALGPVEAPRADERPRRKPRLPGTGLTALEPEIDDKVKLIHPRAFEVLARTEKLFRPDKLRMTDEVRGELGASTSVKRWLFGGLANDPEALRNKMPMLACLVCVTLRPGETPQVELSGPSGSPWFDRAARESLERAAVPERPDEALDPARACYRFSTKVPFQLNFQSTVRLVSYERLGS